MDNTTNRLRILAQQKVEAKRRARLENASQHRLSPHVESAPPMDALPIPQENETFTDEQEREMFTSILNARRNIALRQHPQFDALRRLVAIRKNVYLIGPAGSGKTTGVKQCADYFKLPFAAPSIGRETTKSELFGFMHAHGLLVRTMLREAWEHGGIILLDEFDYASAASGTCLNTLTSQPFAGFPDGTIARHPDFCLVATANTYGTGATQSYIGANVLNAATLDRFVFLPWGYDEAMERAISGNDDWAVHVQKARQATQTEKINFVISPRATIDGADCLAAGFTLDETEKMVLFKGLDALTVEKIKNKMLAHIGTPALDPITGAPEPPEINFAPGQQFSWLGA